MKNILTTIFAVLLSIGATAAPVSKTCSLCVGLVSDKTTAPVETVPLLMRVDATELSEAGTYLQTLTAEQRRATAVVVTLKLTDPSSLEEADRRGKEIVEWAAAAGPFASFGIDPSESNPPIATYLIKQLSVNVQGREIATRLAAGPMDLDRLTALHEQGATAYFDDLHVTGDSASTVEWLIANDPSKKVIAIVSPSDANHLYDAARALAVGAAQTYVEVSPSAEAVRAFASFNREMVGDFSPDPTAGITLLNPDGTARPGSALAFVRGEDLRTVVVPPGRSDAAQIISLPSDDLLNPRRISDGETVAITDTGKKGGRLLVGFPATTVPFALTVERPNFVNPEIVKDTVNVATRKGITVEEIIRNHQAYRAFQKSIQPRYIAQNETKLRFSAGPGGDSIESSLVGPYFFDPNGTSDWVWQDFFVNGVKWKYGRIPELPLMQPEKVTQLPLDIHFTNDYRYQLVRETAVRGFQTYEVRFTPPSDARADLPLYRGTVWIDSTTWARIRLSMVQLNLSGEILSNEEKIDFEPFDRTSGQRLAANQILPNSTKSLLWLPSHVDAQQVLSTAGRSTVVLRETTFSKVELSPADFSIRHQAASASSARMIRETDKGIRYLEKGPDGERVVEEGIDTSRTFLLGGFHHDAGLEFPVVPLGGIDFFNFNLGGRGVQTNVFFAGVILAANITDPSFRGTRTNLGADLFGIAIPFENSMRRNGELAEAETVKSLPVNLTLRAGHPILNFGKVDVSLGLSHLSYQRSEKTGVGFEVPSDTFVLSPRIETRYDRWGYAVTGFAELSRRTTWEPWGLASEFDDAQQQFTTFGGSIGKNFYLPRFQRIGLELDYLDGRNLDRFSKYELGFFGPQRIRGIGSGSVRAEKALLGHISYGLVFSQQFRLEVFYDHGLIDDAAAGYAREPFQGVGIGGQTIGPWGTILRMDLGKTIGRNAQDDFVANIVFLKLFG